MPRRVSSTDQLPLFGDGLSVPPVPSPGTVATVEPGGVSPLTGPASAIPASSVIAAENGQPRPLPPHSHPRAGGASHALVQRGELFHAWAYGGFALTPEERLRDARAKFVAIYGVPPGLIGVPTAEAAAYAGLDPLVEAREHTPALVLWLLVPVGVRGRRDNGQTAGGGE